MSNANPSPIAQLKRIYGWRRLKVVLITCLIFNFLFGLSWQAPMWMLTARLALIGFTQLTVFGLLEAWPRRLPRWLPRWALQVLGVALITPPIAFAAYSLTLASSMPTWWTDPDRLMGWFTMTLMGLLVAPWICVSALFQKITNAAEKQALGFALEKSELERRASEARLTLLQAQMEPHFLFNTLANIRELVLAGSSQAPQVLESLIAYLRAAVPRLRDSGATLRQELDLVRAYLDIMQMRMPDRLKYRIDTQAGVMDLPCPPMSLLTLVENAVHHGIDPQEEGGEIFISAEQVGDRLRLSVRDDGAGLRATSLTQGASSQSDRLGTGLTRLRERLVLAHGTTASLQLQPAPPRGTLATLEYPVLQRTPASAALNPQSASAH
jgi:Histidine kinase/Histidine kinase-, DNA gyrase B-, and HSP90-like ATPase